MFFTQEDYRKIEQWLQRNSVKDTEFQEALPLNGLETITLVQDEHNKKVFIKDLVDQIFKLGVSDFLNVTDKYEIQEAINNLVNLASQKAFDNKYADMRIDLGKIDHGMNKTQSGSFRLFDYLTRNENNQNTNNYKMAIYIYYFLNCYKQNAYWRDGRHFKKLYT